MRHIDEIGNEVVTSLHATCLPVSRQHLRRNPLSAGVDDVIRHTKLGLKATRGLFGDEAIQLEIQDHLLVGLERWAAKLLIPTKTHDVRTETSIADHEISGGDQLSGGVAGKFQYPIDGVFGVGTILVAGK